MNQRSVAAGIGAAALALFLSAPALAAGTSPSSSTLPPGLRAPFYLLTTDSPVRIEQKVTASDGAASDFFGSSVAVDGTVAMIGSPNSAINGQWSVGAVYVYNEVDGTWVFAQKLTASDGGYGYNFGRSVALKGTTAIIGSPKAGAPFLGGAAYVFTESNGNWSQTQEIAADDSAGGDRFGTSVALDGTTVLVGAPGVPNSDVAPGAAYVFTDSGGTWSQVQKLTQSDANIYNFGWAVAVDGTNAFVGAACFWEIDLGTCTASLGYVFVETNGVWNQATISSAGGSSVALLGTIAVTGAVPHYLDADYGWTQGMAGVYHELNGVWDGPQGFYGQNDGLDDFGDSVAIDTNTLLVGADYATGNFYGEPGPGSVHEFTNSGGIWTEAPVLVASDGANDDDFGNSVALSGTTDLIGADNATVNGHLYQGAAYFYGEADLSLALSAPVSVPQGQDYVSQAIATNAASVASPAVAVTVAVPAAASFISANASQGSCSEDTGVVTCSFGQIASNGGTATANVTLKATGNIGDSIENTASVSKATPALTASAATQIVQGNCAGGYSEYDGTLAPYAHTLEPDGQPYQAPAGQENAVLSAPAGFQLYAVYWDPQEHRTIHRVPGGELHQYGPKGTYAWMVRAGASGGDFTFCLKHP